MPPRARRVERGVSPAISGSAEPGYGRDVDAELRRQAGEVELAEVDPTSALARAAMDRYFAELADRFGFDAAGEGHAGPFLVASHAGAAVACGGVRVLPGVGAEIKRMWVDPSWRGAGLGRRMLAELEGVARRSGQSRIVLDTKAALTPAVALYERSGYRRIERYNDNPDAELFFEKTLV